MRRNLVTGLVLCALAVACGATQPTPQSQHTKLFTEGFRGAQWGMSPPAAHDVLMAACRVEFGDDLQSTVYLDSVSGYECRIAPRYFGSVLAAASMEPDLEAYDPSIRPAVFSQFDTILTIVHGPSEPVTDSSTLSKLPPNVVRATHRQTDETDIWLYQLADSGDTRIQVVYECKALIRWREQVDQLEERVWKNHVPPQDRDAATTLRFTVPDHPTTFTTPPQQIYAGGPSLAPDIDPRWGPSAAIVAMRLLVDASGIVRYVQILQPTGADMAFMEHSVDQAYDYRYRPALRDGVAVPYWLTTSLGYRMR